MNKKLFLSLFIGPLLVSCAVSSEVSPTNTKTAYSGMPTQVSATPTAPVVNTELPTDDITQIVEDEMKGSFDFFWEQANTTPGSSGFGLVRDRYPGSESIASIASTGFGLTAYLIGINKGYITEQEGYERVSQTLDTLLAMDREEGFYYHFVDIESGKRAWES